MRPAARRPASWCASGASSRARRTSRSSPSARSSGPTSPRWRTRSRRAARDSGRGAVELKAKTNEGMGFIGRGEGIAVIAVATLETTLMERFVAWLAELSPLDHLPRSSALSHPGRERLPADALRCGCRAGRLPRPSTPPSPPSGLCSSRGRPIWPARSASTCWRAGTGASFCQPAGAPPAAARGDPRHRAGVPPLRAVRDVPRPASCRAFRAVVAPFAGLVNLSPVRALVPMAVGVGHLVRRH